jgi:hypothetical protein
MATEPLDLVRLKIGDTDTEAALLTDAEIEVFMEAWPDNVEMAAADAAEAIAAKFARDYTFGEDGQSFNRRERFESYTDLAAKLRSRGGIFVWPVAPPEEP